MITETLHCLLVERRPPADVRQVHVLTTAVGAKRIREDLLRLRDGWFHRFCRERRIPSTRIRFNARTIHVVTAPDGTPLDDVRTPEENASVADSVLALVRDLTRDPAVALHASVAGGRKTMGLFLGIAFQLLARPQDRLSHVLVSPPELEGDPAFFYPPRLPATLTIKGKRVSTADARIDLAEIPVLLLRDKLQPIGLESHSYSELVLRGQQELDRLIEPPALVLRSRERTATVSETVISLTPMEFAVYRFLADRRRGCPAATCPGCSTCALEAGDFDAPEVRTKLAEYLEVLRVRDERARSLSGWRDAAYKRFREVRARINGKIGKGLGSGRWADRYLIGTAGRRPDTRYYLPLPPDLIRLE